MYRHLSQLHGAARSPVGFVSGNLKSEPTLLGVFLGLRSGECLWRNPDYSIDTLVQKVFLGQRAAKGVLWLAVAPQGGLACLCRVCRVVLWAMRRFCPPREDFGEVWFT